MNQKELEIVLKLEGPKRYEYFIKKIVDFEELWGLYNDGWAMTCDDNYNEMIPLWPKKEFAEFCAINEWEKYKAKSINLYDFIDKWLPDMKKKFIKPSIFWNNNDSVVLAIDDLIKDLNEELENY